MTLASVSLGLGDYTVIAGMLAATTGSLLFYLKTLTRRVEVVERRADKVTEDKVDRRDWLREALSTRAKVDHLSEQLVGIDRKLDAEWGMAAAVNRVADRIAAAMEKNA